MMNTLKKQTIALIALVGMCTCVQGRSLQEDQVKEQFPKVLDRAHIGFDGKSYDVEFRIALKDEVETDETDKPILDKSGLEKTIQVPIYQLVIPSADGGQPQDAIVVSEMDLLIVHVRYGQKCKDAAFLGWDPKNKQLYVVRMLSVDNTIYVEVSRAPVLVDQSDRVVWAPTTPFALVTVLGTEISGRHPAEGGRVIPREAAVELEIRREGISGPPTTLTFDEQKRTWSTLGTETLRQ